MTFCWQWRKYMKTCGHTLPSSSSLTQWLCHHPAQNPITDPLSPLLLSGDWIRSRTKPLYKTQPEKRESNRLNQQEKTQRQWQELSERPARAPPQKTRKDEQKADLTLMSREACRYLETRARSLSFARSHRINKHWRADAQHPPPFTRGWILDEGGWPTPILQHNGHARALSFSTYVLHRISWQGSIFGALFTHPHKQRIAETIFTCNSWVEDAKRWISIAHWFPVFPVKTHRHLSKTD